MSPQPKYRLEPVLEQKERAKKDAEKALAAARQAMEEEERKKEQLEKEKAALNERIEATKVKRDQKAMEGSLSVKESQQYKIFINGLTDQRKEVDLKIFKQSKAVERAAEAVEKAKTELVRCAKEHEAMAKHKEQWLNQLKLEEQKKEQKLMEEIGMIQFMRRKGENQ